jgi:hypothetical protein
MIGPPSTESTDEAERPRRESESEPESVVMRS